MVLLALDQFLPGAFFQNHKHEPILAVLCPRALQMPAVMTARLKVRVVESPSLMQIAGAPDVAPPVMNTSNGVYARHSPRQTSSLVSLAWVVLVCYAERLLDDLKILDPIIGVIAIAVAQESGWPFAIVVQPHKVRGLSVSPKEPSVSVAFLAWHPNPRPNLRMSRRNGSDKRARLRLIPESAPHVRLRQRADAHQPFLFGRFMRLIMPSS